MGRHDETARRYRDKAEELRTMVAYIKDQNAREIFENLATNYDHLANVQDSLAKVDTAAGTTPIL